MDNEAGEPTAVIVRIWREIASGRDTAYLLKSETMRQRLQAALERGTGIPLDEAVAKLGLYSHRFPGPRGHGGRTGRAHPRCGIQLAGDLVEMPLGLQLENRN